MFHRLRSVHLRLQVLLTERALQEVSEESSVHWTMMTLPDYPLCLLSDSMSAVCIAGYTVLAVSHSLEKEQECDPAEDDA